MSASRLPETPDARPAGVAVRRGAAFRLDGAGWGRWVEEVSHAIAVREVSAVAAAEEFEASERGDLLKRLWQSSAGLLGAVRGAAVGSALELRYIAEPRPRAPTRVRLFLCTKVCGDDDQSAARGASAAVERACAALPAGYEWRPAEPAAAHIDLPPTATMTEVRKQEELLEPAPGLVPTDFYYITYPVAGDATGWPQFGRLLSQVSEPVVVSLLFIAASLDATERGNIARMTTLLEHYGHSRSEPDALGNMSHVPADANATAALTYWQGYQENMRQCLLARTLVAGPGTAAREIATQLAAAVSVSDDGGPRASMTTQEPRDEQSARAVRHSIEWLEIVPWGGHSLWRTQAAPHSLRRLPYLVGLNEASTLALLPVPTTTGAPGFPLKQRGGRPSHIVDEHDIGPAVVLGAVVHDRQSTCDARLPLAVMNRHTLVVGASGSGKTTTVLSLLTQLWRDHGVPFIAIEPTKTEYRSLLDVSGMEDLRIVTFGRDDLAPIRLNPLAPSAGVRCETHRNGLMAALKGALPLDPPLPQLLESAMERAYLQAGWEDESMPEDGLRPPTIRDLVDAVERVIREEGYVGDIRETLRAASSLRLLSLTRGTRGLVLDTVESTDFSQLMERPVVIELDEVGDNYDKAMLAAFILERIRAAAKTRRKRGCAHVTVLEEAHRLLARLASADSAQALAITAFCEAIAEMRAYGEAFVISSQSPSALADAAVANTNTRILHRMESAADRDVVLNDLDAGTLVRQAAARLGQGEALVKWPGMDEPEVIRMRPADGVDTGLVIGNDEVRERMAGETQAVRRLMPYGLCTRDMCPDGCEPGVRAHGRKIARGQAEQAARIWRECEGTVRALAPIVEALNRAAGADAQLAYCAAAHLAVARDAFKVPGKDIRPQLAGAVRTAAEKADERA